MAVPGFTAAASNARDPLALPLGFALALALASAGALHEICAVQPADYLVPGFGPPRFVPTVIGIACAVLGAYSLGRRAHPEQRLAWLCAFSAVITGGSAPLLFAAFGHGGPLDALALAIPALGGLSIGATIATVWRVLGTRLMALGAGAWLVSPFRLLALALLAIGAAGAASVIGVLRSALGPAMILAVLAFAWPPVYSRLDRRTLTGARKSRAFSFCVALACAAGFVGAEHWIPAREIKQYTNPIVFRLRSERQEFVVTSGQDTFELHLDGRLKWSGVDEVRYFEALVQPAMAVAPEMRRVLVLGGGTGLLEREILRHASVESVTDVMIDRRLVDLSKRLSWLARRAARALDSPKISVIEAEPIVWLGETADRFDIVIVDLPDPESYTVAKSYTSYFYRLLAEHLSPNGVIAIQAASPFGSTRTFASIDATIRSTGLETLPYHAAVPTFGDWGFVLAARGAPPDRGRLARAAPYLSGVTLTELEYVPRDLRSDQPGEVSTLSHQRLVDLFQEDHQGS